MSEWISVKTRLPEKNQVCLIYIPGFYHAEIKKVVDIDFGTWDGTEFQWCLTGIYENETITHWMPLPEPPEEAI